MEITEVREHLATLHGVREQRRGGRIGWNVDNRLVAREEDSESIVIRSDFEARERLVDAHPATFSVTPPLEAHMKVLADLVRGDPNAVREALTAACCSAPEQRPAPSPPGVADSVAGAFVQTLI